MSIKSLLQEVFKYAPRASDSLVDYKYEKPDPVPIAPPLGYQPTPPIEELIQQMITNHVLRAEMEAAGAETFEEADDFEVGEDYDPTSPYEETFDVIGDQAKKVLRREEERALLLKRLDELRPKPKEHDDGERYTGTQSVGVADGDKRSGRGDPKRKGKSKSQRSADDKRSVSEADRDDGDAEE